MKTKNSNSKKDKAEKCEFCKEVKTLINAHIIPKGFVRYEVKKIEEKLKKLEKKSGQAYLIEIEKNNNPKVLKNNGYSDPDILCSDCDHNFGKYEGHLIKFLKNSNDISKYHYRNISCAIKGILWKAHITKHQEFKNFDLGKYGDILYKSLLQSLNTQDSIPPQDFPIWIRRYKNVLGSRSDKNDLLQDMIQFSSKGRFNHGRLYRFDLMGHQIIIIVGGTTLPETINQFITNDNPNIIEILYRFNGYPTKSMSQAFWYTYLC